MKVLVVGGDARAAALARSLARSRRVTDVLTTVPFRNGAVPAGADPNGVVPLSVQAPLALLDWARREEIGLTVVSSCTSYAAEVGEIFRSAGLPVLAPSRRCVGLAASRAWKKVLLARGGVPTPPFFVCNRPDDAVAMVRAMPTPVVLRADGFSNGSGMVVASTVREAEEVLRRQMSTGDGGREVVLEAWLEGREFSVLAFFDEHRIVVAPTVGDYRRLEEGGHGPFTTGMGACVPAVDCSEGDRATILSRIVRPTVQVFRTAGMITRGVLNFRVVVTADGPWLQDVDVGPGEGSTQLLAAGLVGDLHALLWATVNGRLRQVRPNWGREALCAVVVCGPMQPEAFAPEASFPELPPDVMLYWGDIGPGCGGMLVGGARLLTLVGRGVDLASARARVYGVLGRAEFAGLRYRRDVGAPLPVPAKPRPSRRR